MKMMLKAPNTLCACATTVQGEITAVTWGIKLIINKTVSCFYMLIAAREPEYCGQNIYGKMIEAFRPFLVEEGHFKSEFLCWKQGKNNSINNSALEKLDL